MIMLKIITCLVLTCSWVQGGQNVSEVQENTVEAQWSVSDGNASQPCLLFTGNLSVIFVHEGEDVETMSEDVRRLHWRINVPETAHARGHCADQQAELGLHWSEDGDKNMINMVISKKERLADLSGVFARLHHRTKKYELTSSMKMNGIKYLSWPHRYCLSCQKTLYYPLFKVSSIKKNHNHNMDDDVPPEAFLVINNLVMEAFNQELEDPTAKISKNAYSKKNWECEFHVIFYWAPYVVGGSLLFLLATLVISFMFKSCFGCSDYSNRNNNDYRKF